MLRDFGLEDFELELSMRDDQSDKWIGSDEFWDYSTNALRNVARASGLKLTEMPGEAAFYGPKIDLKTRDAIGRTWQLSTVQVDPNLPERFELEFTDRDGQKKRPDHDPPRAVRLDRAILRDPARALRRGVPGVARAGAGRRHPGRRRVRAVPRARSSTGCAASACAPSSTRATTACRRRSARTRPRRCRSS